ncbi:hypothetical protein [Tenacibaculum jejuense]|uniref:Lipoprotein n=1 Tax=Tenacibaculum jejuense TaxID=584609 RepID=A0A238UGG9_9FLAO|nr:hypothetical protein [Tenacibaculum jejuense]SNR17450.1 exported protein of unknown function [Tenacibaculum jejuense]
MEKILFFVLFCLSVSAFAQQVPGGQVPNDYYKQGYNTGCNLGKLDDTKLLNATMSEPNFPSEYKVGVLEGFNKCHKPKKDTDSGGITKFADCLNRPGGSIGKCSKYRFPSNPEVKH